MVIRYARLLAALGLAASVHPAAAETVRPGQLWLNTTVFGSLGDAAFFAEVQPRFGNGISQLDQLLLRPAVGWTVNPGLVLYQGYARIEDHSPRDRVRFEDRSFQEINWQLGVIGGVKVSSRSRFEQRWQSYGRDTGFRLRENLRIAVPLTERKTGVSAIASTEVFVTLNDTDWGARAGFERVRTFVGVELPIGGTSTFEIGYLNQVFRTPARGLDMDHILALNVLVRN